MNYVILCISKSEVQDVVAKANLKNCEHLTRNNCANTKGAPIYIKVDSNGQYAGNWQDYYTNSNFCRYFKEAMYGDTELVFGTSILNGDYVCPWIPVEDEQHPPKGYQLLTQKEQETTFKCDEAIYWNSTHNRWDGVIMGSYWNPRYTYAILTGTVLIECF